MYHAHYSCPSPNQLFMPHITSLDFVPWPALREFAVQIPEMQEHMEYFVDMCINIRCDWFFASEEAFYRNAETGLLDLCELAKVSATSSSDAFQQSANCSRPR
jgi:hypothetical protein